MTKEQLLETLKHYKKGTYINVVRVKELKDNIKEISTYTCRLGLNSKSIFKDKTTTKSGWQVYQNEYVNSNKDNTKEYLKVYTTNNKHHKVNRLYKNENRYLDSEEVENLNLKHNSSSIDKMFILPLNEIIKIN